ncbi:hypothetical protein [Cobetia sp. Ld8]|uniref:hypothetical protein n=1 Tax=Cobetia sp. Ld8 TaxID=649154 RepID=UPI003869DFDF
MNSISTSRIVLMLGGASLFITPAIYVVCFGTNLSDQQTTWAHFGTFFGGILNPIIAFLAILMLYQTLNTQIKEFKSSVEHLSAASDTAAKNLELAQEQRLDNETFTVLSNGEKQLTDLLFRVVSPEGSLNKLQIFHMCMEAQRTNGPLEASDSYIKFIEVAQSEGSFVWSYVYSLNEIVNNMFDILKEHKAKHPDKNSPTIAYYNNRLITIAPLLRDSGYISESRYIEIKSLTSQHEKN